MESIHSHSNKESSSSGILWMVLMLGSLSAIGPLCMDMYLPALPGIADEFTTSTSMVQLSLTACLLGLSLGQLVAGPLSDSFGRRKPLLIGMSIYVIATILCALSPSAQTFIALRFIQGAAGAAGIVLSRAITRDLYSGTALTKFFAMLMLVNGVAPIAAPIIGGQLLKATSWRGVFWVLSVLGILMLVAVTLRMRETLPAEKRTVGGIRQSFASMGRLIGNRVFMGYALSQGLIMAAMFAYISGSPFVLQDLFGVSPQMYSAIFAMNGVGIIIAGQIAGRLAGRVRESSLLLAGLILAAIGGVALLVAVLSGGGLAFVLPPLFIIVSCVGIVGAASFSLAMRDQAQSAGSASALLGVLSFIAGGLVAPLVGLGGSGTAVPMGIIIAVADVSALVSYLLMIGRRSAREEEKRAAS